MLLGKNVKVGYEKVQVRDSHHIYLIHCEPLSYYIPPSLSRPPTPFAVPPRHVVPGRVL